MGLSDQVRDHVVVIVASAFAAGAALSWGVAEQIRVAPKDDEIGRLERRIQDLSQNTPDTVASGKIVQLETEVRRLTVELARARQIAGTPDNSSIDPNASDGSGPAENQVALVSASPVTVQEAPGLRVELLSCSLKEDRLTCSFSATSTDEDKSVYLRESRLVERDGNELDASAQQFGRDTSDGSQVYAALVRGIPIRGSVTFSGLNVPLSQDGISLIEMRFDELKAQFRGVRLK